MLAVSACGTAPAATQPVSNSHPGRPVTSVHAGQPVTSSLAGLTSTVVRPGHPVPSRAVRRLTAMADQFVKIDGDNPVQWAIAVVTTHAQALRAVMPGESEPLGGAVVVYVVTIKGRFVCNTCKGPSGSPAPTGTYASFVLGANGSSEGDFGLGNQPPAIPLSRLGPVTYLNVHP